MAELTYFALDKTASSEYHINQNENHFQIRSCRPETAAHGKLVCLQCGATRPLECHMLDELSTHLKDAHGFRIEPSRTVLYGLCAKCAGEETPREHICNGGCCHEH